MENDYEESTDPPTTAHMAQLAKTTKLGGAARQEDVMALTAKREGFAQSVAAQRLNLSEAYRENFDTSKMKPAVVNARASELAKVPAVAARITYLQGEATAAAVKKIGYTLADAMVQADTAFEKAEEFEQAGAMVSAATLKAKLAGYLVDREKVVRAGPLDDADIRELLRLRDKLKEEMDQEAAAEEMAGAPPAPVADPRGGNRPTTRTLQ